MMEPYTFSDETAARVMSILLSDLKDLNTLRNQFAHHLFSSTFKSETLDFEIEKGVELCDRINVSIYSLMVLVNPSNLQISRNDDLTPLMESAIEEIEAIINKVE